MKRTGPMNAQLLGLIKELKKRSLEDETPLWKRIATDLERPTRQRRIVNISRINRASKENEVIVVPGKVLGTGSIGHKVTVAAFDFSTGAVEKLQSQNCSCMSIFDLLQKNPKGEKVRIIG